jgi:F0F1-type ATP synthase delta subunit
METPADDKRLNALEEIMRAFKAENENRMTITDKEVIISLRLTRAQFAARFASAAGAVVTLVHFFWK